MMLAPSFHGGTGPKNCLKLKSAQQSRPFLSLCTCTHCCLLTQQIPAPSQRLASALILGRVISLVPFATGGVSSTCPFSRDVAQIAVLSESQDLKSRDHRASLRCGSPASQNPARCQKSCLGPFIYDINKTIACV